jgi:hypothetical protein
LTKDKNFIMCEEKRTGYQNGAESKTRTEHHDEDNPRGPVSAATINYNWANKYLALQLSLQLSLSVLTFSIPYNQFRWLKDTVMAKSLRAIAPADVSEG